MGIEQSFCNSAGYGQGAKTMSINQNESVKPKGNGHRKRGGQPGNTNALKHGFYTKNFSLAERQGLESINEIVLADEIALLRVLIRRFSAQILASQGVSLNESAQHLAVISEAMLRLASLLRTNHMLGGSDTGNLTQELCLSLAEIYKEMGLNES
jgi:hypothetical protein